jgi:hypothetical protein
MTLSPEPHVARRSKAWKQEEIEPKAETGALTLCAFEIRRLYSPCVELILSSSKASGRVEPAVGQRVAHAEDRRLTKQSM